MGKKKSESETDSDLPVQGNDLNQRAEKAMLDAQWDYVKRNRLSDLHPESLNQSKQE